MCDFRQDEKNNIRLLLEYREELKRVGAIVRVLFGFFMAIHWVTENLDKVRKWLVWLLIPFVLSEWQNLLKVIEVVKQ